MAQPDRVGMKPVHHRSPARSTLAKLTLPSPFLIEFLGHNPEPVRGWKIARQTERRECIPGARLGTVTLIAAVAPRRQPRGVTCPVADRGGTLMDYAAVSVGNMA